MVAIARYWVRDYDEKGNGSIAIYLPDTVTIENMVGYALEAAPLIDALISGYISRVGLSVKIDLPAGIKTSALAGSDLELGCDFAFDSTETRRTGFKIPAFDRNLFYIPDGIYLNTSLAPVMALLSAMIDGLDATPSGGDQVVEPVDSRGGAIYDYDTASKTYKQNNYG